MSLPKAPKAPKAPKPTRSRKAPAAASASDAHAKAPKRPKAASARPAAALPLPEAVAPRKSRSGANRAEHHRARGQVGLSTWMPAELMAAAKAKAASEGRSFRDWLIGAMTAAVERGGAPHPLPAPTDLPHRHWADFAMGAITASADDPWRPALHRRLAEIGPDLEALRASVARMPDESDLRHWLDGQIRELRPVIAAWHKAAGK